ncbi:hypothetical protein [Mediterraneibacter gnavus]|jgi:hypothetical protein|uniref:hypothetical protein n=1 Tax=Mediterraneibacter gnavus TaxID=33038 RepID=UPI002331042C|nr:hypothetical protein [Mediterraneibacter gnavus]MDB8712068.1 hypothetical protein [Mediterraneibacter gnavus]MDB8715093.1 hypothetical protein [Mediterraneibacter gnavus]
MAEEVKKEQASVRSFRITNDVMGRFKELQDEMNLTQDGALKMLVDAYEMEQAKNAIPDRETEISNFQMKANELVEAFLHSLQLNQDAEARIRSEVALQLESKDKVIVDLQKQLDGTRDMLTASETAALEAQNMIDTLDRVVKETRESESKALASLKDKEEINSMLAGKIKDAEQQLADYPELKKKLDTVNAELNNAVQAIKDNQKDTAIAAERAAADKARAVASVERDLEKAHKDEMQRLYDKIEALQEERFELKDKFRSLESENERLRKLVDDKN